MRYFFFFSPAIPCLSTTTSILLCLLVSFSCTTTIAAYRIGDIVDTEVAWNTQSSPIDVMREQMPRFAINSQTQVSIALDDTNDSSSSAIAKIITFSFEDGLWGMPAVTVEEPSLDRLVIQFVYSAGAIHAIHSEPVYREKQQQQQQQEALKRSSFTVQYVWMEEPHVTSEAGQAVMFLVVVCVSVWIVWTILIRTPDRSSSNRGMECSSYEAIIPKYE